MLRYAIQEINKFINTESKKILKNIGWLFFDKVFRMGMALVVGAWVARYLGPSEFGAFNYLMATIGILGPFAALGLDSMIVKEIVDNPKRISQIISTAVTLRLLAGLLSFLVCIGVFYFLKHDDMRLFFVGCVLALTLMAQSLNTIELYYQSQVASRVTVIAQNSAYILMSIVKIVLILVEAKLIAFAVVTAVEMTIGGLFMLGAYLKISKQSMQLMVYRDIAKHLLEKSWPLILSGFMIMIYMRIDQVMLGEMINDYEVGTYSAALKLSEIWYFIAGIVSTSFFPSIIEARKVSRELYLSKLQRVFDVLFLISFALALFVTLTSGLIIDILYGDQYEDAATILSIHIWTAIFVFFGVAAGNFFIMENLQIKTFNRTAVGAVVNIVLNLFLIPRYAAVGAAVATLISQVFSAYLVDLMSRKTYVLFVMKSKSLFVINSVRRLVRRG
jgi:PST family polysaccharide transporter